MTEETQTQEQESDTGAAVDGSELAQLADELGAGEQAEVGQQEPEGEEGPTTAEVLQPLISFGCDLACPNYQIQKGEKQALAESYGELVDKYFPGGIGAFGVELNALLVTAAIFGPRVAQRVPPREKQAEAEQETDGESAENEG